MTSDLDCGVARDAVDHDTLTLTALNDGVSAGDRGRRGSGDGVGHAAGHEDAALRPLDGLGSHRRGDIVGFVLGLGLQGEQPAQVGLDLGAVLAGLAQQYEQLIVTLAGGPLTETGTAHRVSGVDRRVDRQTRRGDAAPGIELARRRGRVLLRLSRVRPNLRGRHRLGSHRFRH